jgi:hypothetical protein
MGMQHILPESRANARNMIWNKAQELWPREGHRCPNVTIGTILGIGQMSFPENRRQLANENNTATTKMWGWTRLLQILISEASHLVWILRCERVIHMEKRQHTDQEVNTRWKRIINDRLTTDRITATKIERDKNFTKLPVVDATWKQTLEQQGSRTRTGCNDVRFLVGRRDRDPEHRGSRSESHTPTPGVYVNTFYPHPGQPRLTRL